MLPLNMQLAGLGRLGDGGPSDYPAQKVDVYGNPIVAWSGGVDGGEYYFNQAGEAVTLPRDSGDQNNPIVYADTPAARLYPNQKIDVYYAPDDLLPVADIVAAPVALAPVANSSAMPQISLPASVAVPNAPANRPGGPNSTIQTPLPPPQTNNSWLTTTNTVGPGYVPPATPAPAPLFSIGPAFAPAAPSVAPAPQQAALPPANVSTLPVAPGTNSGGYAPSWISSGGGGGVFIPDSGSGGVSAGAVPETKSTNALLLGALALLFALSQ